ncbi:MULTISPECIES: hypothetical protein [Brucella]|uniref:Uncharacterized protein n=1 Tax=Brucella tritici TaxID=94626 RepID=A0A6L3YB13_9HYPH|nr:MULTISPECIES: hypothetical protein [Brucella]KAB2681147.1 hypothetical protein F9L08_19810 [Brucella tritici]KAB2757373.1 hypothetical protein F9K98_23530 [Brucella anthropi]KAB2775247.1 hypothetical protein F9K99_22610 [Brucella anthropi]
MISNERARLLYGSLLSTLFQLGLDRFVRIETRTNDSYEDKLSYLIEEIRASLLDLPIIKQKTERLLGGKIHFLSDEEIQSHEYEKQHAERVHPQFDARILELSERLGNILTRYSEMIKDKNDYDNNPDPRPFR